jgi:adenylate cyclase, class 2
MNYLAPNFSMPIINFEFKAKADNLEELEQKLQKLDPVFKGVDHQVDTYFNVDRGRLKLREGNIENALIHYERENTAEAKQSAILLYQHEPDNILKEILIKTLGIKITVDKIRRIYFIANVKFHFDKVSGLGNFIEVEAIDKTGEIGLISLKEQCSFYAQLFEIQPDDYIPNSYSDMLPAALNS